MDIGQIFIVLFINPFTNIIVAIYQLLVMLHIPYPLGFSIILLTIAIRAIMWPILATQTHQMHKMQKLTPHMAKLKEKHKSDKKKQQEEIMKLYKEHGVNPAAGCLPAIVQLVVFGSLYSTLLHFASSSSAQAVAAINKALYFQFLHLPDGKGLDTSFFGLNIAVSPQTMLSYAPLILLVPLLTAALQFVLSKMMAPVKLPEDKKAPKKEADFATAFQTQSLYIFPLMIGFFSFTLPVGMALYWNTFTLFGIIQQYILVGPGAAGPWFKKVNLNKD
ncbi:MAG: YidC/Oxa1 family membrane protein insertase [Candidatus Levybacteria bacterium]|nr:YidC/Oxa1 family membrane protein insertase [Candidatus Levybacteria bacterium]